MRELQQRRARNEGGEVRIEMSPMGLGQARQEDITLPKEPVYEIPLDSVPSTSATKTTQGPSMQEILLAARKEAPPPPPKACTRDSQDHFDYRRRGL